MEKKETGLTNLIVIVMSIIFAGMSALMIFVTGVAIEYLIYAICAAAVIVGIVMIVRYFMTDAYRNMNAYGFSIGTLFVLLGICGFLRASDMAGAFLVILGIVLLLAGIIMLQHSLDLYRMRDVLRIPTMILAIAVLICALMAILQPFKVSIEYSVVIWWMILVVGGISLLVNIYTLIKVKLFDKKEKKQAEAQVSEAVVCEDATDAIASSEPVGITESTGTKVPEAEIAEETEARDAEASADVIADASEGETEDGQV